MKRRITWTFFVLMFVIAVAGAFRTGRTYAQPANVVPQIPLAWGVVKGTMGNALVLESPEDGTIRIYDLRTNKAVTYYRSR
jgi:hypothetical protein